MTEKTTLYPGKGRAGTISQSRTLKIISHSAVETQRLGRLIGKKAEAGDVYLLVGGLGAGKTCLSQGIARGLGIKGYVMSPTFVLMREHRGGRLPLFHIDFYRLQKIEELQDLGLDEYFYGSGVSIVEWAEKGVGLLPSGHLLVNIEIAPDNVRHFKFQATDDKHQRIISSIKTRKKSVGNRNNADC